MKEMGYEFEIMPANIDEKAIRHDNPRELVLALANAKADALLPRIAELYPESVEGPIILITADQVVAWKNEIREKPQDEQEERYFLQTYHEAPAEIINGVVVTNTATGKRVYAGDSNTVYFKKFPEEAIEQFVKEEAVYKRAGGLAIHDAMAERYTEKIEGSFDSIMGLPKELVERLMKEVQDD